MPGSQVRAGDVLPSAKVRRHTQPRYHRHYPRPNLRTGILRRAAYRVVAAQRQFGAEPPLHHLPRIHRHLQRRTHRHRYPSPQRGAAYRVVARDPSLAPCAAYRVVTRIARLIPRPAFRGIYHPTRSNRRPGTVTHALPCRRTQRGLQRRSHHHSRPRRRAAYRVVAQIPILAPLAAYRVVARIPSLAPCAAYRVVARFAPRVAAAPAAAGDSCKGLMATAPRTPSETDATSSMTRVSRSRRPAWEAPAGGGMAVGMPRTRSVEMWHAGIASWTIGKVIPLDGSDMMLCPC